VAVVGGLALVVPRLRKPPAPPSLPTKPRTPTVDTPTIESPTVPAPVREKPVEAPPVEAPPVEAPPVLETPEPTAGRLVRLRARLARSQSVFGKGLLALLSRDKLDDDT